VRCSTHDHFNRSPILSGSRSPMDVENGVVARRHEQFPWTCTRPTFTAGAAVCRIYASFAGIRLEEIILARPGIHGGSVFRARNVMVVSYRPKSFLSQM